MLKTLAAEGAEVMAVAHAEAARDRAIRPGESFDVLVEEGAIMGPALDGPIQALIASAVERAVRLCRRRV